MLLAARIARPRAPVAGATFSRLPNTTFIPAGDHASFRNAAAENTISQVNATAYAASVRSVVIRRSYALDLYHDVTQSVSQRDTQQAATERARGTRGEGS